MLLRLLWTCNGECCSIRVELTSTTLTAVAIRRNSHQFWQRMRQLKTTQGTYNGPIYRASGHNRATVQDLDLAMLDTRAFWEEHPPETQQSWHPILAEYQSGNNLFPPFPDLTIPKIQSHRLHTKESAPGLGGIPYAAWRLNPEASGHAIYQLYLNIITAQEAPPSQVLVWIPKATAGPTGDYFRPLGMPNTSHRVLDLSALVVSHCSKQPTPIAINAQPLPRTAEGRPFHPTRPRRHRTTGSPLHRHGESLRKGQPPLGSRCHACQRLSNLACPVCIMYLFTGRRVLHKVGGQLLPP